MGQNGQVAPGAEFIVQKPVLQGWCKKTGWFLGL